nr:orf108EGC138 [uncultured bacterium]
MQGVRTAKLLSYFCVLLLAVILCFRAFVYSHLYIAPNDPYGISDIIELLLGCMLILALALSAGIALVLGVKGPRPNRLAAAWLGLVVVLVAVATGPLHTVVARLAST